MTIMPGAATFMLSVIVAAQRPYNPRARGDDDEQECAPDF
jgi:hypothetical protein